MSGISKIFTIDDYTQALFSNEIQHIPTNGGWTEALVGTGSIIQTPSALITASGASAGGSALASIAAYGLNNEGIVPRIDFGYDMVIAFSISFTGDDANIIRRVQLKQAGTIGELDADGIGIYLENKHLYAEAFGSSGSAARGSVSLISTLATTYQNNVLIAHKPNLDRIEFYVNNVYRAAITDPDCIPKTNTYGSGYLCISCQNGASAVEASFGISYPTIIKKN